MSNEQKGWGSRGAGVGPYSITPVDMRPQGLTIEGFERNRVIILGPKDYELLLKVATEIGSRTKRMFAVLTPQYQLNEDGTVLAEGNVRVIKSGPLYDDVFEPLRQMREDMIKEGTSEDVIERTISDVLEANIAELNDASDETHDALR